MIDTHSHIIYGIDDGSVSIEESVSMIKKMRNAGYSAIIATPHYIDDTEYRANNKEKQERLELIREKVKESNIDIKLYLGNEVFIGDFIIDKILNKEIYTLNNSDYIMIELPLDEKLNYDLDVIYNLIDKGAKVVLAHPERYRIFKKNYKEVQKYLDMGVLLQGNIDSLSGKYGRDSKKLFIKLLKERKYFILGSDIHTTISKFYDRVNDLKSEAIKLTDENYINQLMVENPSKIINNIIIDGEKVYNI